jgi:AMP-binding enzyme
VSKGALGLLSAFWPEDTPRYAHIPLKTVGDATIYPIAATAPHSAALVSARGSLEYGELAEKSRRFADAMRNRVERGARVAIVETDPATMLIAALGALEASALCYLNAGAPPQAVLQAFAPDLVVGAGTAPGTAPIAAFDEMMSAPGKERPARPDLRTPILALPMPGGRGEVLHNHRSLTATAISVGGFFMLAEGINVVLLEPPTNWSALALALGALQRGATLWAGWEPAAPALPARADYVVCGSNRAARLLEEAPGAGLPARIDAGLIMAIEGPFSVSRRLRLSRRLRAEVLTLLGRNDLGPVLGSHPSWFLNDAAGIPLPNVDLRPLNPTDGAPLNLGWEAVDSAELGVKSALAPAGGVAVEGWLRSGLIAQIDPTGLYFLLRAGHVRAV